MYISNRADKMVKTTVNSNHRGRKARMLLRWRRGHVPPQINLLLLIQKLTDHSDVISEVPKCSTIQIFRGSAPDPPWGAYSDPPDPLLMGRGSLPLPRTPTPLSALPASFLLVSGSNLL